MDEYPVRVYVHVGRMKYEKNSIKWNFGRKL